MPGIFLSYKAVRNSIIITSYYGWMYDGYALLCEKRYIEILQSLGRYTILVF